MPSSEDLILVTSSLKTASAIRLAQKLPREERAAFLAACATENKTLLQFLLFPCFLGGLGVDRFLIGDTVLGLFRLFKLGGCMI